MRLIDADRLNREIKDKFGYYSATAFVRNMQDLSQVEIFKHIMRLIEEAPTIEESQAGELELIKRALLIFCRNVRPDGDMSYFDWEDRCKLQDIYHELIKEEAEKVKEEEEEEKITLQELPKRTWRAEE